MHLACSEVYSSLEVADWSDVWQCFSPEESKMLTEKTHTHTHNKKAQRKKKLSHTSWFEELMLLKMSTTQSDLQIQLNPYEKF